jgi:hypothetical protein
MLPAASTPMSPTSSCTHLTPSMSRLPPRKGVGAQAAGHTLFLLHH